MKYFWQSMKDWKTYAYCVVYMGCDMPLYAFSLFLPTIIREGGFAGGSTTTANLLSVPPYAAAAVLTITLGWYADRTKRRGWANTCISLLGIAGFAILLGTSNPSVQYAGVFLAAMGIYPCKYPSGEIFSVPLSGRGILEINACANIPQASPTQSHGPQTTSKEATNAASQSASSSAGEISTASYLATSIPRRTLHDISPVMVSYSDTW